MQGLMDVFYNFGTSNMSGEMVSAVGYSRKLQSPFFVMPSAHRPGTCLEVKILKIDSRNE